MKLKTILLAALLTTPLQAGELTNRKGKVIATYETEQEFVQVMRRFTPKKVIARELKNGGDSIVYIVAADTEHPGAKKDLIDFLQHPEHFDTTKQRARLVYNTLEEALQAKQYQRLAQEHGIEHMYVIAIDGKELDIIGLYKDRVQVADTTGHGQYRELANR